MNCVSISNALLFVCTHRIQTPIALDILKKNIICSIERNSPGKRGSIDHKMLLRILSSGIY